MLLALVQKFCTTSPPSFSYHEENHHSHINPDLFMETKKSPYEIISKEANSTMGGAESHTKESSKQKLVSNLFLELRLPEVLERCTEWEKLSFKPKQKPMR